ncbi:MAG: GNAT family N-acetyltransferase [Elusimicrobia bacterium]|nr:GNAT family N-acetyltransferase [Elusimicrobiota bacterium]MDE2512105.1 GNAT family N-acetyltransferase [Elusimicrobiota bacterium]
MNVSIRRASAEDWAGIAEVCASSGAAGEPVEDSERAAFASHWIGPYRELRPDWAWAAVSDGKVVGYLTGAPDTLGFEKERRRVFNPPPDSREFFPPAIRLKLWTEHPAHLLMNVAADYRGMGLGARLLQAFFAELRRAGAPSAHVICGPTSSAFFERMAFRAEALVTPAPGLTLRAMTRPVD